VWLALFFIAPMYVVMAIVFGRIDPVFRTPLPVWNPLQWNPAQFTYVFSHLVGKQGFFGAALFRTLVYVAVASLLCLLIAPFWISYMMRMLAWVNLLQNDGLVNRTLSLGGLFNVNVDWLSGRSTTVILGLVYGYVPYMILPLFAGLDRIQQSVLEAARDLGAGPLSTFRRVTWRLSLPAVVASVLLSCLPMLGDYFTNDLLSASPSTSMVGNLINNSALAPGQTGQAGAFVLIVLVVSLLPMLWYVRTSRDEGARS
jgi:spermidine/putrescine transport system permease protein